VNGSEPPPDRLLTLLAWVSPVVILATGLDLVIRPVRWLIAVVALAFWVGWLVLVTDERRHRRRDRREAASSPPRPGT
jgi:hypothetical protein